VGGLQSVGLKGPIKRLQARRSSKPRGVLGLCLGLRGGQLAYKLGKRSSLACLALESLLELQPGKGISGALALGMLGRG
jgi:hypothetical protein